jgi:hypothetical protein
MPNSKKVTKKDKKKVKASKKKITNSNKNNINVKVVNESYNKKKNVKRHSNGKQPKNMGSHVPIIINHHMAQPDYSSQFLHLMQSHQQNNNNLLQNNNKQTGPPLLLPADTYRTLNEPAPVSSYVSPAAVIVSKVAVHSASAPASLAASSSSKSNHTQVVPTSGETASSFMSFDEKRDRIRTRRSSTLEHISNKELMTPKNISSQNLITNNDDAGYDADNYQGLNIESSRRLKHDPVTNVKNLIDHFDKIAASSASKKQGKGGEKDNASIPAVKPVRRSTRNGPADTSETPKTKKSLTNSAYYENNVNKMKIQYNLFKRNGIHDKEMKEEFKTWLAYKNFPDEDVKKFKSDLKSKKGGFDFEDNER